MIRRYTLAPPLAPLPGDTFAVVAGVLEQRRAGALVAFRVLAAMASADLTAPEITPGGPTIQSLYLEVPAVVSVSVVAVVFNESGTITVNYSDGDSVEYADRDAVRGAAASVAAAAAAKKLLLARWEGRNPALDDAGAINGAAVDVNMESVQQPVVFGDV